MQTQMDIIFGELKVNRHIKRKTWDKDICHTRLSVLFHLWPQNRSDMRKLVSVLFLGNGRISQTCVLCWAV